MGFLDHFRKTDVPATPQLKDFHPVDTGLSQAVRDLAEEFGKKELPAPIPCGRDQFIALLAGVPALRRMPGILGPGESGEDYFTTLPRCATPEAEAECRAHLKKIFGIADRESLLDFCKREICCHRQYLDFVGFWEGSPSFDMAELNREALEYFQTMRDFSAQFYPIVGRAGYLAWDICECVGHLRTGYACGILTKEELDELAEYWIAQAQIFKNWADFAVSVVCGELYWDFRGGSRLPELNRGLELWTRLVRTLLDDTAAWGSGMWYESADRTKQ